MKYRVKMSDEELKEELLFLALGPVENFEVWLEDFDWFTSPYTRCVLVHAVVEYFYAGPNTSRERIMFAKLHALQRNKAERRQQAARAHINILLGAPKNIVNTNVF